MTEADGVGAAASKVAAEVVPSSLRALATYFLRLGAIGFGGPIPLAGYMQRDLVEERRWISKQDYVEGLALAELSPAQPRRAARLVLGLGARRRLGSRARRLGV